MDEGYDVVETSLPALITVVKEINQPRVPSLKGKMKAKSLKVTTLERQGYRRRREHDAGSRVLPRRSSGYSRLPPAASGRS